MTEYSQKITRHPKPIIPFIRWAGGKQKLINQLLPYLPLDIPTRKYWEPFVGSGSLFFSLHPKEAVLSDANEHLINCYKQVRENHLLVYKYLRQHANNTGKEYYYKIRSLYNRTGNSIAQAARFIYLNKTCFNGIFRVNLKGEFNVPYGWKEPPALPSLKLLRSASKALKNATIYSDSFETNIDQITTSDFIYLDPPYPPLNGTSNFTHYTADRFGENDQNKLAEYIKTVDGKGCKFMLSNADTPLIRKLYSHFFIIDLSVTRWITCKSKKHRVSELLITNYDSFIKDFER